MLVLSCILSSCWLLFTSLLVRSCSLFSVNVAVGKHEERMLLTGMHTVADVVCIVCDEVVGWKYVRYMHLVCSLACACLGCCGCARVVDATCVLRVARLASTEFAGVVRVDDLGVRLMYGLCRSLSCLCCMVLACALRLTLLLCLVVLGRPLRSTAAVFTCACSWRRTRRRKSTSRASLFWKSNGWTRSLAGHSFHGGCL